MKSGTLCYYILIVIEQDLQKNNEIGVWFIIRNRNINFFTNTYILYIFYARPHQLVLEELLFNYELF